MDHLSPLDAVFVNAEDGITHMAIGSCAIFAGPPPAPDEVVALIASKLPLLPRYRQRLRSVPGGIGHPVWVDDAEFDVANHVHHVTLDRPGGEAELDALMGNVMSSELDRRRPLWATWVVEGLSDDRWALISKVHHCMVDGVSGTDMMAVLLDASPDAQTATPAPWKPRRAPTALELALGATGDLALMPARILRRALADVRSPRSAMRRMAVVSAGAGSLAACSQPTPPSSLTGAIGRDRRYAAAHCSLDDARVIHSAFGCSINDVVLAVIAGALRDILAEDGEDVDAAVVRTLVPVSMRSAGDTTPNNQVSLIIAELPVAVPDPLQRLAKVHAEMTELKEAHQIDAGQAVVELASFTPPVAQALFVRAVTATVRLLPQRSINTVTTNVPGPQRPLFALGRGMLEYLPFVPIGQGLRVGIAILSYNGHLAFGVTGDADAGPDVAEIAARIEAQMTTLRAHADLERGGHRRSRAGSVAS
jgi:diacylglycerol O-acyltransferase